MRRSLFIALVGAALAGCAAVSVPAQQASSAAPPAAGSAPAESAQADWYAAYLRGHHMVRLADGRTLSLYCAGKGSPTIVMEAGLSENALTWWTVQPSLAKLSRVCVYDRAGLGLSPVGPMPRDTRAEVADLEQLLTAGRVKPPYLLVGHSMGGFNMRLFASRHLEQIAGMMLIDPSVENQIPIFEKAVPATIEGNQRSLRRAKACADPNRSPDIVKYCIRAAPPSFPPALAKQFNEIQGLPRSQTVYSESLSFSERDSAQVLAERRSFGAMPLVILTRGKLADNLPPDQAATEARMLMEMHDELAKLSSVGSNRRVEGADHYIHVDKPDAVVDAVSEVLAAARKRGRHH